MSPDYLVQENLIAADGIANAQPYPCEDCSAQFSTLSKKNKHRNGHLKPYNCLVPECLKKFSQKQSLDRHHEACHRESSIPAKYYHCTTQNCKYSSCGSIRKTFSREDHVKAHIKDYGHYGPASPPERRRRPCDKAGLGIILTEIQVEAIFEEWSPARNSQPQRSVRHCVFNSLKTNLWYKDDIENFCIRGEPMNTSAFHCEKTGCYFNSRPPDGVSLIAFTSSEALLDHYRQAHNSLHQTSLSDQPLQSSSTQTSQDNFKSMSAVTLSLPIVYNKSSIPADLQPSQYLQASSTEQPWSPHRLCWGADAVGESDFMSRAPPDPFNYFSYSPIMGLSDKASIANQPSDISYSTKLDIDGITEAPSDRAMTSFSSSPTDRPTFPLPYSETDDRISVCSESITSASGSVVSSISRRSTSSLATTRNPSVCNYCQMSFTRKADRERHEKTRHILSPTHRCRICPRSFSRKDKLVEHSRKHDESLSERGSMGTLYAPDLLVPEAQTLGFPEEGYNPALGNATGFMEF